MGGCRLTAGQEQGQAGWGCLLPPQDAVLRFLPSLHPAPLPQGSTGAGTPVGTAWAGRLGRRPTESHWLPGGRGDLPPPSLGIGVPTAETAVSLITWATLWGVISSINQ